MRTIPRSSRLPSGANHLSAGALVAYTLDHHPGDQSGAPAFHLRRCSSCRSLARGAQVLALAMRAGALEPVPAELHERALALWDRKRTNGLARAMSGARERLLGMLRMVRPPVWAGSAALAPVGVRGAGSVARCELAGRGYRLELEWLPSGRGWTLRGRVLAPERAPLKRLVLEAKRARPVSVGARGFFGPVRGVSGPMRARVETGGGHFLTPWIDVPSPGERRPRKRV